MEKHLQQILQEVNTIIIPGLGALTVTNHKTGEIMFMPYLKYDDGKLATFIAEKEGITLDEAKVLISKDVSSILSAIEAGNGFNLNGIGSFKKDFSGDIEFKSGVYVETSSAVSVSEDVNEIEESVAEEISTKVEEQIIEEPIDESVASVVEEEIEGLKILHIPAQFNT